MSTILHPVHNHAWWYGAAAAALATGLVIVLMTTVFSRSGSLVEQTPPPTSVVHGGHAYAVPCFAGHPGNPIELARSGCRA